MSIIFATLLRTCPGYAHAKKYRNRLNITVINVWDHVNAIYTGVSTQKTVVPVESQCEHRKNSGQWRIFYTEGTPFQLQRPVLGDGS